MNKNELISSKISTDLMKYHLVLTKTFQERMKQFFSDFRLSTRNSLGITQYTIPDHYLIINESFFFYFVIDLYSLLSSDF